MNIYFQTIFFYNDNNIILTKNDVKYYLDFSRSEKYDYYKGSKDDRFYENENEEEEEINAKDYDIYGQIFLRVDNSRFIIQRKYQKFQEFVADVSSLINGIYIILKILVQFMNEFIGVQSILEEMFILKDNKKNKVFNFNKIEKKIYSNNENNLENKSCSRINVSQSFWNVNNNSFNNVNNNVRDNSLNLKSNLLILNHRTKSCNNNNNYLKKIKTNQFLFNNKFNLEYKNKRNSVMRNIKKNQFNTHIILLKNKKINNLNFTKNFNFNSGKTMEIKNKKDKIKLRISFRELIFLSLFKCCLYKKLAKKQVIIKKAKTILFFQLDIRNYLLNFRLFSLLQNFVLEDYQIELLKYFSKQSINLNGDYKIFELDMENLGKKEFNELLIKLSNLINNKEKNDIEKKICDLIKEDY